MIIPHLFQQISAIMSSGGQGDRPENINWPARDWRYFGAKPKTQPKTKPRKGAGVCSLCSWICCGTARALIAEAFGLGKIELSPKVSKGWG